MRLHVLVLEEQNPLRIEQALVPVLQNMIPNGSVNGDSLAVSLKRLFHGARGINKICFTEVVPEGDEGVLGIPGDVDKLASGAVFDRVGERNIRHVSGQEARGGKGSHVWDFVIVEEVHVYVGYKIMSIAAEERVVLGCDRVLSTVQ